MAKYARCLFILLLFGTGIKAQNANAISISTIPHKLFWENNPKSFSIGRDQIVIETGKETDMFRDPNVTYNTDDGIQWFLIRHLQFDSSKGFKVGFLAQSPTGDRCEVKFSNIVYIAKKIKDPYLGE